MNSNTLKQVKLELLSRTHDPESKHLIDTLSLSDLINHFSSMVESFVTFAKNCPTFQDLCKEDQSELLEKNSLMFVMVSLFLC